MTEDATQGHKDEVAERRVDRAFRPRWWLIPAAVLMIAIVLTWVFLL